MDLQGNNGKQPSIRVMSKQGQRMMSQGPPMSDPQGVTDMSQQAEVKYHPRFASKGGGGKGNVKDA